MIEWYTGNYANFFHPENWYLHKTESVLEIHMHDILSEFVKKMIHSRPKDQNKC